MSTTTMSKVAVQNQLVTWVNEAGMAEGNKKLDLIRKITEVLLNQVPEMIPALLESVLSFATNKCNEVKKQVIIFIEEMSKLQPTYLPKAVTVLRTLMSDSVVAVVKRVIQASSIVYRHVYLWISKNISSVEDMQFVWKQMSELKIQVLDKIDSDNEGIRTHSIKFLEEIVLLQTPRDELTTELDNVTGVDSLPSLPFVDVKALDQESMHIFKLLVNFHNSQHISSVNLMTCMSSLCNLAKHRPKYMPYVLKALEDLQSTLPPTLSQSQVNSVRKHLKMLLTSMLKHPSTNEFVTQLCQLLSDIGMSQQEINKLLPKDKRRKRAAESKSSEVANKRSRVDTSSQRTVPSTSEADKEPTILDNAAYELVKQSLTEDHVYDGLCSINKVVALVSKTLVNNLPAKMPANYPQIYKPVVNAGTDTQKRSLAKLIYSAIKDPASQTAGQPSLSEIAAKLTSGKQSDEKTALKIAVAKLQETAKADKKIESAVSKLREETRLQHLKDEEKKASKPRPPPTPSIPRLRQKVRMLRLQELTVPIPKETKERLILSAVSRILYAEENANIGGVSQIRTKLLTIFASSYTPQLRDLVLNYILEDPANRVNLAITWLYQEYSFMQGFNRHPVTLHKSNEKHDQNYNQLLCSLITYICERCDPISDNAKTDLLKTIYVEAPIITSEAVDYLKHLITESKMTEDAILLLEEICIMRPPRAHKFVVALLNLILHEKESTRQLCLTSVLKIYKMSPDSVKKVIEKYAKVFLGFISMNLPPLDLFSEDTRMKRKWTDELYKVCIVLIMELVPLNEELLLEISSVYGQAKADAKRCVLRCIEAPMRQLCDGEIRPAFLALLEECPRGSETLLTRLMHILTEKTPPTKELVARVRDLYATRVSDVRFLIPVLNGLTKKEILAALPQLIKLNPVVVKEVFNKLLGLGGTRDDENLPVSPSELLVALHLIDLDMADLRFIIKATVLCFSEKQTYTEEVLSSVIQQLIEENEIPVLMMRTILQALAIYPGLSGLVLNVMLRLIEKEVWTNKIAWEGWIKCCERTLPTSVGIAMHLPAAPLAACLSSAPAVAAAMKDHVAAMTPAQRVALPEYVVALLQKPAEPVQPTHQPPIDISSHYMAENA